MYINEVIRRCDLYCPNEYSLCEKYTWCDDLSAMLTQEHDRRYAAVRVKKGRDDTYLLPEGITYEMIDSILYHGREIKKYDWRSYKILYLHLPRHEIFIPEGCCGISGDIEVVYIKPHEKIRDTVIEGTISFAIDNSFTFKGGGIRAGDTVNIRAKKVPGGEIAEALNVPILSCDMTKNYNEFRAYTVEGAFDSIFSKAEGVAMGTTGEIRRVVTEETVCPPPYDLMYVDYVMAQICFYQRDFATYNRHMTNFNQRLSAFDAWLQKRRVQEKKNEIINWL